MVDKSRLVDVDGSLKEREWDTEEFYAVLNQHTEQVRTLTSDQSSIACSNLDEILNRYSLAFHNLLCYL